MRTEPHNVVPQAASFRSWAVMTSKEDSALGDPLEYLCEGLREALRIDGDKNRNSREAFKHSLGVVIHFLQANETVRSEKLITPLMKGLNALYDLDRGQVHPMLQPAIFANRPPASVEFRLIQAIAVGLTDALALDPKKRTIKAASEEVAKAFERRGIGKVEGKPISGTRILGWRKAMEKDQKEREEEAKQTNKPAEDDPFQKCRYDIVELATCLNSEDSIVGEKILIEYMISRCLKPKITPEQ